MNEFSLTHLTDQVLLSNLGALVARDRANTAALLAHIAEVDARKLYLPAACPSMYEYCVHEMHLSESEAFTRIRAARTARQYPAVFAALAGGRLNLSGVLLLAPYLTLENAGEILIAATREVGAAATTSAVAIARKHPFASVPRTVKLEVPTVVGVPASTPALVRVIPAGSAPTVTPKL